MKIILLTSVLLLSLTGFAAVEEEPVIILKKPETPMSETSRGKRENKTATIAYQGAVTSPNGIPEAGVTAAYFLNAQQQILLNASKGASSPAIDLFFDTQIKGQTVSLYFKQFTGNSFYIAGGLDQRSVSFKTREKFFSGIFGLTSTEYSFEGTATSIGAVIGNQWQWNSFTLGCDWFGISRTIASDIKSETSFQNNLDKQKDRYLTGTSAHLLRLYVGASF